MSEEELNQIRAKIEATQESVKTSLKNQQRLKAEDEGCIEMLFGQYLAFTGRAKRKARSTCNAGPPVKQPKIATEQDSVEKKQEGNGRWREIFSAAIQVFDLHEDRCNAPLINYNSPNSQSHLPALENYRLEQRHRQVAILKSLQFEFDAEDNEIDQTSAGYVWLRAKLYDFSR